MITQIPISDNNQPRWLSLSTPEMSQQMQTIYIRIITQRWLALWEICEIYSKNLSRLEILAAQGQEDVRIPNQIEATKQEMAQIELEMKGEAGLLFQVRKFYELSCS